MNKTYKLFVAPNPTHLETADCAWFIDRESGILGTPEGMFQLHAQGKNYFSGTIAGLKHAVVKGRKLHITSV